MRASELIKFSHFHILKLLFPSIFFWYFRYFQIHLISGVNILHTYTINAVSYYYSRYGAIYKRQYIHRQNTNIEKMYVYASEQSERA